MIRISESRGDNGLVIQIAGRLEEQHLAELEQMCGDQGDCPVVDLSELQSAETAGIRWLSAASSNGVEIINATPYIALLIDRARQAARASTEADR
jgi:anti-anti-sigma regulatory factor